jgi:hypothetical protein
VTDMTDLTDATDGTESEATEANDAGARLAHSYTHEGNGNALFHATVIYFVLK